MRSYTNHSRLSSLIDKISKPVLRNTASTTVTTPQLKQGSAHDKTNTTASSFSPYINKTRQHGAKSANSVKYPSTKRATDKHSPSPLDASESNMTELIKPTTEPEKNDSVIKDTPPKESSAEKSTPIQFKDADQSNSTITPSIREKTKKTIVCSWLSSNNNTIKIGCKENPTMVQKAHHSD